MISFARLGSSYEVSDELLNHFTRPEHLAAIAKDGLLPLEDRRDMADGKTVVWLTEEASADYLEAGAVKLTVDLPSDDPKLFRYMPWLREKLWDSAPDPKEALAEFPNPDLWWLYFGTIPPLRIIAGLRGY